MLFKSILPAIAIAYAVSLNAQPHLKSEVDAGQYRFQAGFTNTVLFDSTRYYLTHHNSGTINPYRPIYVNIWYPATKPQKATELKFSDYVYAGLTPKPASLLTLNEKDSLKQILSDNLSYFSVTETDVQRMLSMPMQGKHNATPIRKKFPMVIISGATNGSPFYFATLGEALATSGFVVVAISSLAENDTSTCSYDTKCLLNQVDDMHKVVEYMKGENYVDTTRISALAWSFGGLSAVLYQQKFNQLKALVSIDAAIGYKYGKELMESSNLFDVENFSIPVLHFQSIRSGEKIPQDLSFFEQITSKRKNVIRNNSLLHADFTSIYGDVLRYGKDIKDNDFNKNQQDVIGQVIAFLKMELSVK